MSRADCGLLPKTLYKRSTTTFADFITCLLIVHSTLLQPGSFLTATNR
jgi:hypothetical protein